MAGRQIEATAKALKAWRQGKKTIARIALNHGIAQSTLYRAIKADASRRADARRIDGEQRN